MTNRRHSLKRCDGLSKKGNKQQLLTGEKRQIAICFLGGSNVTATFINYNKTSDKASTMQLNG
jgi:hypothetical protein